MGFKQGTGWNDRLYESILCQSSLKYLLTKSSRSSSAPLGKGVAEHIEAT